MEKKFKCQSCGSEFIADTNKYVTCPSCGSDNVALSKGSGKALKIVLFSVLGVVVLGIIIALVILLLNKKNNSSEDYDDVTVDVVDEPTPVETDEEVLEDITSSLPVELVPVEVGTPQYDKENDTYSLRVKYAMQNAKDGEYKIVYTLSTIDGKEIASNENGLFLGLKPITVSGANPEASYVVAIKALKGGEAKYEDSTNVPGFKAIPKGVTKMTVAEVQDIINRKASASEYSTNPRLTNPVAVRCQGSMGDEAVPNSLNKLIQQIKMSNSLTGATVVSLEYDDQNRVKCIVFKPILSNE